MNFNNSVSLIINVSLSLQALSKVQCFLVWFTYQILNKTYIFLLITKRNFMCEKNQRLKAISYFHKKVRLWMFGKGPKSTFVNNFLHSFVLRAQLLADYFI